MNEALPDIPLCVLCQEKNASEPCCECGNDLCETCLEEHRHCIDCGGTGEREWSVLRTNSGEIDYLHGIPTGEKQSEECKRCEGTGLEI